MSHSTLQPRHTGMAIHELVIEAHDEGKRERRADVRYPFFRPVSLSVAGRRHAGFSREISATGVGLLHNFPIPPGDFEVAIPSRRGHSVRVRTRLVWCRPCGEGWYISGGQFVGITSVEA